jgi:hypothetical protein
MPRRTLSQATSPWETVDDITVGVSSFDMLFVPGTRLAEILFELTSSVTAGLLYITLGTGMAVGVNLDGNGNNYESHIDRSENINRTVVRDNVATGAGAFGGGVLAWQPYGVSAGQEHWSGRVILPLRATGVARAIRSYTAVANSAASANHLGEAQHGAIRYGGNVNTAISNCRFGITSGTFTGTFICRRY